MIHCPSCDSAKFVKVHSNVVNQHYHLEILPKTFELLRCSDCNLYYKAEMPDEEKLFRFYNEVAENEWEHAKLFPHERKIHELLTSLPKGKEILDVGCGTGVVLSHFAHVHDCYGVEANANAGAIAMKRGIKILGSWISPNIGNGKQFDVIIVSDVFEHLVRPFYVVSSLYEMLKQNGQIIIITGRTDCLPYRWFGAYYWYFQFAQHLVFLNRRYLLWLEKNLPGSKIIAKATQHYDLELGQFTKDLATSIKWSISSFVRRVFGKRIKPLELFFFKGWYDHYFITIKRTSRK